MGDAPAKSAASGAELLAAGEQALERGESRKAFDLLQRAAQLGVEPPELHRLASSFAQAGRYLSRHADVLRWVEKSIEGAESAEHRVTLLRARVAVCRQLDLKRVLEIAEEALSAADEIGDEEAYACVLSHAAFAGYRRGDARAANEFAERALDRTFTSRNALFDSVRARMFAATARGDVEEALTCAIRSRALARDLGRVADVANESNNLAEFYLTLGCSAEARACANQARTLADECGHRSVEHFAKVLHAIATAEAGYIDDALDQFDRIEALDHNRVFAIDMASAHSYWLLERGAAGDARLAREIAVDAIGVATRSGVSNRLTPLYANVARGYAREGNERSARSALEQARQAADRAEPTSQLLLALAAAEVLPVTEPKRKVGLNQARARILRQAARREDPRAYCIDVRLNRRLLELSGGVPSDLPDPA